MEALSNYLEQLTAFGNRLFVSSPPGPAFLIWSNKEFLPNITGISIIEQEGALPGKGPKSAEIVEILRKQLFGTIPILHIIYKSDLSAMKINGSTYVLAEAAQIISDTFHIAIGSNPAKAPNDANQIIDPFHIWSRAAFDGSTVMKTDIDFLLIKDHKVDSIWEVKRSAKIKVGSWIPYVNPSKPNDVNNYYMLMSLSNLLKARMITVHHEEMNADAVLTGEEKADFYVYTPGPNQNMLNTFALRTENTTRVINEVFNIDRK